MKLSKILDSKLSYSRLLNLFLTISNLLILGFNIHFLCNEYPRNENLGIDYIGVIVGILSFIVAILALMFGYNLIVHWNKIKLKINKIDNELKEFDNLIKNEYIKSIGDSMKVSSIQINLYKFVNENIKEGILSFNKKLMLIIDSLKEAKELDNPYVSASLLNDLLKIISSIENYKNVVENPACFDYEKMLHELMFQNINIIKKYNKSDLLIHDNNNNIAIIDVVNKLIDALT